MHYPGHENPADFMTHGALAFFLISKKQWGNSPVWLSHPDITWTFKALGSPSGQLPEQLPLPPTLACLATMRHQELMLQLDCYSSLTCILRVTAWMQHFRNNASASLPSAAGTLSAEEIISADAYWLHVGAIRCLSCRHPSTSSQLSGFHHIEHIIVSPVPCD